MQQHPLQFAIHGERVEANFKRIHKREPFVPYPLSSFNIGTLQRDWDRSRTVLHLWGPTDIGKTKLAQALLPGALLVRHLSHLKQRHEGQGIIFDDLSFKCLDIEECLHICDVADDTQVNVKHSHASIERGTPRIVTSNFADIWPADPAGSLERRLFRWECKAPLHQPQSTVANRTEATGVQDTKDGTPRSEGEGECSQQACDQEEPGTDEAETQEGSWRLPQELLAREQESPVPRRRSSSESPRLSPERGGSPSNAGRREVIDLSQDDDVVPFFPRILPEDELDAWELF